MIDKYLRVGIRNLVKHRSYSVLNIGGLTLGLASCLLILLYIFSEKSYDKWLPDLDRIHRVSIDITSQHGDHMMFAPVTPMAAGALSQFPQVEEVTRILKPFAAGRLTSDGGEKKFYENYFYWADPNVFSIFKYSFVAGSASSALSAPNTVVITKDIAGKYFDVRENFESVLSKSLLINNKSYRITGVINNIPANSTFKCELIASLKELEGKDILNNWQSTMFYTFVKLKASANADVFGNQIHNLADRYIGDQLKQDGEVYRFFLQPLTSIHLHSDLRFELSKNNSATYISIFMIVAVFILLIACFNFINLSTAMAQQRAKEVGVRKVIGAQRNQLVKQFLIETLLISFIATVFAFLIVQLSLPWFNVVAEKQLSASDLFSPFFILIGVSAMCVTTLLSGLYPSFILSGFNPITALNSRFTGGNIRGRFLRSGLVISQFAVSIIIIISTLVVSRQLSFLKEQNLGFNKDKLLVIHSPGGRLLKDKFSIIRNEFEKNNMVESISVSGTIPGRTIGNNLVSLKADSTRSTDMQLIQVDEKFLNTYNIPLVAGRNISENLSADTSGDEHGVLINEAALPIYGWKKPEDAIGNVFNGGWGKVIGVVKDFHFTSLQSKVAPLQLYFSPNNFEYITVRIKSINLKATINDLESRWKSLVQTHPFEYFFLDDDFNKQYVFEDRVERLFKIFSFISIVIACLGLFGLATYTIIQRTKEIGIRKVLGASVSSIVSLLSREFITLILIALLIASPIAWWAMHKWLQNFAYQTNIGWQAFALTTVIAIVVAFTTISFQAIKAAITNPVKSLRTE